jgi:hypothetical protein
MNFLLVDVCITAASVPVIIGVLAYIGVSSFTKEAKEKRLTEKGYSFGHVVAGALIGFVTLFVLIFYELFLKSRYAR